MFKSPLHEYPYVGGFMQSQHLCRAGVAFQHSEPPTYQHPWAALCKVSICVVLMWPFSIMTLYVAPAHDHHLQSFTKDLGWKDLAPASFSARVCDRPWRRGRDTALGLCC